MPSEILPPFWHPSAAGGFILDWDGVLAETKLNFAPVREKYFEGRFVPLFEVMEVFPPDTAAAARLHVNDVRRVARALEIFALTGTAPSEWFRTRDKISGEEEFDVFYIGLNRDRRLLFEAIERRVGEQFAGGFPEEVEWLLSRGYDERFPSMQGFARVCSI